MNMTRRLIQMLLCSFAISGFCASADADLPTAGQQLPDFSLQVPASAQGQAYLGVSGDSVFKLTDIPANVLLLEIMGVYCPRCHEQAPLFGSLYARMQRGELKDKVKMLAVAVGATPMEVDLVRTQWGIKHPVVPDEKFEIHKVLGEPKTPFTMIVDRDGRVHYAHEGVIKDVDGLYQLIKNLVP